MIEIARKLKDAGFVPTKLGLTIKSGTRIEGITDELYIPTLEELIEACGDGLERLETTSTGWECGKVFADYEDNYIDEDKPYGTGSTPLEAVANLWLALNKK